MSHPIRFYQFPSFLEAGVPHAITGRQGGVSPSPWTSLNLGTKVGDDPENIAANNQRVVEQFDWQLLKRRELHQVHGDQVLRANFEENAGPLPEGDGLICSEDGLLLSMRFADCVPILLFDPSRRVAGMAHAGWRGTVMRVAAATVAAMASQFGSQPDDLLAGIGPSICADHYEVGEDVAHPARETFGSDPEILQPAGPGKVKFDLWRANRRVLRDAGVAQIEVAGQCTACNTNDWYSHRAEQGRTGRFAAFLTLPGR